MYEFTNLKIQELFENCLSYEQKIVALFDNREDLDIEHLASLKMCMTIVEEYDDIFSRLGIEDDYIKFMKKKKTIEGVKNINVKILHI